MFFNPNTRATKKKKSHHCRREEFYNSLQSCSQIHSEASSMTNSRCKGSSGERKGKTVENPGMSAGETQKQERSDRRSKEQGQTSSFRGTDGFFCRLQNSELEPQHQKYKGRVVLRGDTVKDDSGAYAVFTERHSHSQPSTSKYMPRVISIIF